MLRTVSVNCMMQDLDYSSMAKYLPIVCEVEFNTEHSKTKWSKVFMVLKFRNLALKNALEHILELLFVF